MILSRDVTWAEWHGLSLVARDLNSIYTESPAALTDRLDLTEAQIAENVGNNTPDKKELDFGDLPDVLPYEPSEVDEDELPLPPLEYKTDPEDELPPARAGRTRSESLPPLPIAARTRAAVGGTKAV